MSEVKCQDFTAANMGFKKLLENGLCLLKFSKSCEKCSQAVQSPISRARWGTGNSNDVLRISTTSLAVGDTVCAIQCDACQTSIL